MGVAVAVGLFVGLLVGLLVGVVPLVGDGLDEPEGLGLDGLVGVGVGEEPPEAGGATPGGPGRGSLPGEAHRPARGDRSASSPPRRSTTHDPDVPLDQ